MLTAVMMCCTIEFPGLTDVDQLFEFDGPPAWETSVVFIKRPGSALLAGDTFIFSPVEVLSRLNYKMNQCHAGNGMLLGFSSPTVGLPQCVVQDR